MSQALTWLDEHGVWIGSRPLKDVKRVLIVVAHPDDLESQAGGSVALLTEAGADIRLLVCTSGDKGSTDRTLTSADLGPIREAEQLDAAGLLGIERVDFLRWPDGEVENGRSLRESVVHVIRQHRPDAVVTHDPVHPWPPYTAHRDHRNVGRAVLDAIYPDARDHLAFPEHLTELGLEPHETPEAWLIMSSAPDWIIDISTTFDVKVEARQRHRSQTGSDEALRRRYAERAEEIGRPAGFTYAEAFKRVRFR